MAGVLCVGHAVEDYVFRVARMPDTPQKHQSDDFERVGGGPAANAAVTIARLGGDAALAARVGDDRVADAIIADLEAEGVNCDLVNRLAGFKSSLSAVMVDEAGQRMIVNYLDPAMPTSADWLRDHFPSRPDAVLADTRWPDGAACALHAAKELGVPGVLDADHPLPQDVDLPTAASHVAFSAQGLSGYASDPGLESGLARVADRLGVWCCVTDGENGVFIDHAGQRTHVPAPTVKVVDTLGAGDVWHGAFCYRLATGDSELDAVRFATAAAALKVTRPGGRQGAPALDEVETFLRERMS